MTVADKLNEDLQKYRKLILIDNDFPYKEEALESLRHNDDVHVYISEGNSYDNIESIPADDFEEIRKQYHMYEFSDRFIAFDNSSQYGSIWNYVELGIMSFSEAIDCL